MPVCLCRVFPRSGSKTTGSERSLERQTDLPERILKVSKSARPSGEGDYIPWGLQLVTAHWLPGCVDLGCEWHKATSNASDSRGGGGGGVLTCDGSADHLDS